MWSESTQNLGCRGPAGPGVPIAEEAGAKSQPIQSTSHESHASPAWVRQSPATVALAPALPPGCRILKCRKAHSHAFWEPRASQSSWRSQTPASESGTLVKTAESQCRVAYSAQSLIPRPAPGSPALTMSYSPAPAVGGPPCLQGSQLNASSLRHLPAHLDSRSCPRTPL